jgi:rhamnulokinase
VAKRNYLAFDLGAESGRAILGSLESGVLSMEELHRFPNQPVRLPTGLYWDTLRLFFEIRSGLATAGRERRLAIDGIGIDTWGVDFALLGRDGALVDNPRHYRDSRTHGVSEKAFRLMPREDIFAHTGVQFMELNSLYQLYAMKLAGSPALETATSLLFMPDLFNYWLTGEQCSEVTIASTSQFYDPAGKRWATEVFDRLGLPSAILEPLREPGGEVGPLLGEVAESAGIEGARVYTTGCHDTASAVAAVPAMGGDWCYISSGTWSLMGLELDRPVINEQSLALNFTNEVGAGGKIRFLKNIAGLWVLQECRRSWQLAGRDWSYGELALMAGESAPFQALLDPDRFLDPGRMPERIVEYCRQTGQTPPETVGEICRAIFESLALRYREVVESLDAVTGRRVGTIHIVGGGSRNEVLNQLVADATGRTVIAGPAEATAAGNILIQAMGAGEVSGLEEAREVVRRSYPVQVFEARPDAAWDEAYERFRRLASR